MLDSKAKVPNPSENFIDSEMWHSWTPGSGNPKSSCYEAYWVEVGVSVGISTGVGGWSDGGETSYAFNASCTKEGEYYEYDYLNMNPGLGSWYTLRAASNYVGSGIWTWYMYYDGVGPWGARAAVPGQALTEGAETGLEFTENSINLNGETDIAEWQNTGGEWFGWKKGSYHSSRSVADAIHYDEEVPACAEANGYKAPGDFSFASLVPAGKKYNTECYEHEGENFARLNEPAALTEPTLDPADAFEEPKKGHQSCPTQRS